MESYTSTRLNDLAAKFKLGDEAACDSMLSQLRSQFMVRFTCAGISQTDAEDLVQTCLTDVIKSLDRFDAKRATMETWTSGIARNKIRNHYRKLRQTAVHEVPCDVAETVVVESSEDLDRVEAIQSAVNLLPLIDQELLQMRFTMGLSFTEIAGSTGLSEANSRKRVSRAVEQLRRQPEIRSILFR